MYAEVQDHYNAIDTLKEAIQLEVELNDGRCSLDTA
jgi:hypothetical protein